MGDHNMKERKEEVQVTGIQMDNAEKAEGGGEHQRQQQREQQQHHQQQQQQQQQQQSALLGKGTRRLEFVDEEPNHHHQKSMTIDKNVDVSGILCLTAANTEPSFIQSTEANYKEHWLTYSDIALIQQTCFSGSDTCSFDIIGCSNHLERCLGQLEKNKLNIFILNFSNVHWITVLIIPEATQAFYFDSRGKIAATDEDFLKYASIFNKCHYTTLDLSVKQQHDGWNCGLWCLLNFQTIVEWYNSGNRDLKTLKSMLKTFEDPTEEKIFFDKKRDEICLALGGQPNIQSSLANSFIKIDSDSCSKAKGTALTTSARLEPQLPPLPNSRVNSAELIMSGGSTAANPKEISFVKSMETSIHNQWLTYSDMALIKRTLFSGSSFWSVGSFDIIECSEQLERCLGKLEGNRLNIFILNLSNIHWLTILVVPKTKQTFFIDSRGTCFANDIDVSKYKRILQTNHYQCLNISIKQQHHEVNCGLWCFLNFETIVTWYNSGKRDIKTLIPMLKTFKDPKDEKNYFERKRNEIFLILGGEITLRILLPKSNTGIESDSHSEAKETEVTVSAHLETPPPPPPSPSTSPPLSSKLSETSAKISSDIDSDDDLFKTE